MPAWARDDTSSRTYTFMPPLSPTPGWASGEEWRERTASRRTNVVNQIADKLSQSDADHGRTQNQDRLWNLFGAQQDAKRD